MRKSIFEMTEATAESGIASNIYDVFMMLVIILSIIPLAFKKEYSAFVYIDYVTGSIFILDYLLRFATADYKLGKGWLSFIIYPFTPMAIIDLISILPSLTLLNNALKVLKVLRLIRTFRVFRAFKVIRYSKSIAIIANVFKKQKKSLYTVAALAIGYVLISALVIFNVEPDTFKNFFEAIYWATVSLTTVGYGDIYPITAIGRIITIISSVFGIAIIALPSGIITAGFMDELNKLREQEQLNAKGDGQNGTEI